MPFALHPLATATAILVATYAAVVWGKVNRSIVALVGASLMMLLGVLDQNEAMAGVDWNTIGLLTGMMILVSIARRSGLFQFMAIWSAQAARAHPAGILLLLQVTTALLSALLDNVTSVLLIVPVTLALTAELEVSPYPFLVAEIFAANIGGAATLIGDPPNILIGSLAGLSFNAFVANMMPVAAMVMVAQIVVMHAVWGRHMRANPQAEARVMALRAADMIRDPRLLKQSLAVLAAVMAAFTLAGPLRLAAATIAMTGAAVLMLLDNWEHHSEKASQNIHATFSDVEWITIFFFIGLFIVVHGVEEAGLLQILAQKLVAWTGPDVARAGFALLWVSAFVSAIIDNIPFVATMIPLIKTTAPSFGGAAHMEPLWWCLALGACLGGNGTLIGASANLTVAGIAERNLVPFRFTTYLMHALPMMAMSIAICHLYVWWRYF